MKYIIAVLINFSCAISFAQKNDSLDFQIGDFAMYHRYSFDSIIDKAIDENIDDFLRGCGVVLVNKDSSEYLKLNGCYGATAFLCNLELGYTGLFDLFSPREYYVYPEENFITNNGLYLGMQEEDFLKLGYKYYSKENKGEISSYSVVYPFLRFEKIMDGKYFANYIFHCGKLINININQYMHANKGNCTYIEKID